MKIAVSISVFLVSVIVIFSYPMSHGMKIDNAWSWDFIFYIGMVTVISARYSESFCRSFKK